MMKRIATALVLAVTICVIELFAQGPAFSYQGSLTDGGNLSNGEFQMQFKLFDASSGGVQQGTTLTNMLVTVTNGVFSVQLTFGAAVFTGENRWLEIAVRRNSGESYITLSPRQQVVSSPYAVRTLSAAMADDSQMLGGVAANQFVQTGDPRLTDQRSPLPGSTNYIQNGQMPQAAASFNIAGTGTTSGFNVNGSFSFGNIAAPPVAPAGQGRFYFDTATNKLRVSENGGPYINVVGAGGISGSGTANRLPLFSAATTLADSNIFQSGTNIGFGTPTPGSGFEMRGTGGGAQQRITDAVSGNSLVLQGGPGSSMKVTGFNYGTGMAQPLYLGTDGANTFINSGGGILGVGTTSPHPLFRIDSFGSIRASSNSHVNFTVETAGTNNGARVNMKTASRNWFIGTSQALNSDQFYIGEGESLTAGQRMVITTGGIFGFGTINPNPGYRADFLGGIRTSDTVSTHVVAETTGPANSWSRFYMRTSNASGTIHRSWYMGTSRDFNNDQFYLVDETGAQTRLSITPGDGPIFLHGNVTGNTGSYGLPKAMLYVLANGTIQRCYNGVTGQTTNPCGFTATREVLGGIGPRYSVNLGFFASQRFYSVVGSGNANFISRVLGTSDNTVRVAFYGEDPIQTQDSDFFLIAY